MNPSSNQSVNTKYIMELGPGLVGTVKNVFVGDIHMTSNDMTMFKDDVSALRYNCYASTLVKDHHYFLPGCGNGYSLGTDSSETCDDAGSLSG